MKLSRLRLCLMAAFLIGTFKGPDLSDLVSTRLFKEPCWPTALDTPNESFLQVIQKRLNLIEISSKSQNLVEISSKLPIY